MELVEFLSSFQEVRDITTLLFTKNTHYIVQPVTATMLAVQFKQMEVVGTWIDVALQQHTLVYFFYISFLNCLYNTSEVASAAIFARH